LYEHNPGDRAESNQERPRSAPPPRAGMPVDWHRLFSIIRQGRTMLLVVAVVGAVCGYVIPKFVMPRTWLSRAVLVYEGSIVRNDAGEESVVADPRELRTLVDSVKLPKNLAEVQKRLGLTGALDLFARRVDVTFDLESNLVEIQGSGDTADAAVELANTMVEVFLEHRKSVDRERLRAGVESVEKNLRAAQAAAKEARDRFDAFRQAKGIADLSVERQRSIQSTADLQAKADMAGARVKELEARIEALGGGGGASTAPNDGAPGDLVTAQDRADYQRLRAELSSLLTRYTPEHPTVQAMEARVAALAAKVGSGGGSEGRGLARLRQERAAAAAEEAALRSQIEASRGTLSKFSNAEGEATNLLAAVEVAEARAKGLRQDLGRAEAKERAASTGFRVESAASRPDSPERSTARMAVAIAIPVFALLIALGLLLWRNLGDLRVCTPAEVAYWGKGPVIGSTTWPRDPRALADLVAEMDDYMVDASGHTLVVPATDRELDLVKAISERFSQADWNPQQVFVTSVEVLPSPITVSDGIAGPVHSSTALAKAQSTALAKETDAAFGLKAEAWTGPDGGPALRRAARRADRVLVIVRASETSAMEVAEIPGRLGRDAGIGYLVVGIEDQYTKLADRAGEVESFWRTFRDKAQG
jgi:uncharacterized protein involved in exopolysaccharide biosynthesis